ncbi:TetR/AcrR family transcriptional regulator [Promicromonospora sp. NPDC050880]|uniref:TetR/AcrR family transcriptional regulator n=1 Tax=Promicromonospora sp. NPDC050880 TaxID=3364406 RepID=UPI00379CCCCE
MARPVQDRAEVILAAARTQFLLDGPERTTVDAVAARAGVGKGTVFLYWPTKARLREAVFRLEAARMLTDLADDLRTGATHLSVGRVVRSEIAAVLENPGMAPLPMTEPDTPFDLDEFPGPALHRVLSIMQRHGLVRDTPTDEVATAFQTVMSGSVTLALAAPDRRATVLDAAERLIRSTYDRPDADPRAVAAALPEVLDALEDTVDRLVDSAAPDRPTTAELRPRPRPAPATA